MGDVAFLVELLVKGLPDALKRSSLGQLVTKQADRILLRHQPTKVEVQKSQPSQSVTDHVFHALVT